MLSQILHVVSETLSAHALAAEGAVDGGRDTVTMAPGLTWNVGIGQIIQVVGILVPVYFMWQKTVLNHAMQARDLIEMRKDITLLMQAQAKNDDYFRQLPAILTGIRRGFLNPDPIKTTGRDFAEAFRNELSSENPEMVERALSALERLAKRD